MAGDDLGECRLARMRWGRQVRRAKLERREGRLVEQPHWRRRKEEEKEVDLDTLAREIEAVQMQVVLVDKKKKVKKKPRQKNNVEGSLTISMTSSTTTYSSTSSWSTKSTSSNSSISSSPPAEITVTCEICEESPGQVGDNDDKGQKIGQPSSMNQAQLSDQNKSRVVLEKVQLMKEDDMKEEVDEVVEKTSEVEEKAVRELQEVDKEVEGLIRVDNEVKEVEVVKEEVEERKEVDDRKDVEGTLEAKNVEEELEDVAKTVGCQFSPAAPACSCWQCGAAHTPEGGLLYRCRGCRRARSGGGLRGVRKFGSQSGSGRSTKCFFVYC